MKKLIIASFVFAVLLVSQNANAASVWNGASNDCPGLAVANHTTNTGIIVPCWPLKSISANKGDSVNIRIYYHNTSGQNATNVRFSLNAPTGASNSHTFSGQITSDQGNASLGNVTVNTPAGSTLKFSSAHWLPNQSQTDSPIPLGQSSKGTEILGSGLNIGTVASSWAAQGSVVIAFLVETPNVIPPSNTPTGTLTPATNSCSIPLNASSCDINFSWNTTNPVGTSAVTRDGGPTVATGNSGSKGFTIPYSTATFRLYNNGLELDTKTVSSSCTNGTSWNGNVCSQNVNPTYSCSIANFTVGGALSTTVTSGSSVELAWTTNNCNYVNIPDVGTNLPANGTYSVSPSYSRSYIITGYGSGANPTRTVNVTVNQTPNPTYSCRITKFDADDTSVDEGDTTLLRWSTENCNSVSISNIGSVSKNGTYRVEPNYTRTYTLKAYGSNGSDSEDVRIYVDEDDNDDYNSNTPSVSTYSPSSVDQTSATLSGYASGNGSRINTWIEFPCYGAKYGQRSNLTSGNITANVYSLSPNSTYSYCAVAENTNTGRVTRGNTVSFTTNSGYVTPTNNCAVTTVATNINQTNAQLNGLITGTNGGNAYFEYGPTVNLGQRTNSRYVSGNINFSEVISGLSANTIYYFRMVSDCGNGVSKGSTEVFRTDTIQTVNTVTKTVYVKQGTTVVGEKSPILLTISNKYQMIGAGDIVDYVVTYKNIGSVTLLKPMVQVVLPTNMTLINSSRGTYGVDTHTLSAQIEDLVPGREGVIYLQARVDSIPLNNSNIPTTAILIYTSTTGSQENAMAYVVNSPMVDGGNVVINGENSTLGGAALFGNMGSIGLVGWLIIILIILMLILIARSVYSKNPNTPTSHGPTH